jgi:hypothetical protein
MSAAAIAAVSDRVARLELQLSSHDLVIIPGLAESVANHEQQLERLLSAISALRADIAKPRTTESVLPLRVSPPARAVRPAPRAVDCPFREPKSLTGIISYLTQKHNGNVHDKGIVTITSKSLYSDEPKFAQKNLADLSSNSKFWSKNGSGQWVCWNFHDIRVRPTHYTIKSADWLCPKSWVVQGSMDGEDWRDLDVQNGVNTLSEDYSLASFQVSNSFECRLIKIVQTGESQGGYSYFALSAFEVFGTLIE